VDAQNDVNPGISDLDTQASADSFEPGGMLKRLYPEAQAGGYSRHDGWIEFYLRVNSLVDHDSQVLDFGAGRAYWMVEPVPRTHREVRLLKGKVARVVGTDIDPAVLDNPSLDEALVVPQGEKLPFPDASFDVVIADYVFEHVTKADAPAVADEIMRVLRPGGWLAARTPNKWGIIGLGARAVPNSFHTRVLRRLQPGRLAEDVFPTQYAMNTRRALRRLFPASRNNVVVYGHTSEPTYFGNSVTAWRAAATLGHLTPPPLAATLMVFVQKRP